MADTMKVLRVSDKIAESSFAMTVRSFELLLTLDCGEGREKIRAADISNYLALPAGIAGWRMRVGTEPQTKTGGSGSSDWERALFYKDGADDYRLGFETFYGPALVRSMEITTDPDAVGSFRITGELSGFGPPNFVEAGDAGTSRSPVPMPIRVTTDTTSRVVSAYREGPIVPGEGVAMGTRFGYQIWDRQLDALNIFGGVSPFLNGYYNPNADTKDEYYRPEGDCGGRPIDFNGAPIPHAVPQTRITIDVVRRLPYWNWANESDTSPVSLSTQDIPGTGGGAPLCVSGFDDYIGARNASTFLGFPIGSILWESINLTPLQDEFSIFRMVFLYDEWKHATQVPRPTYGTTTGAMTTRVILQENPLITEEDPRAIRHYMGVYWQQPYLRKFTLNPAFFYTEEMNFLNKLGECAD